MRYNIKIIDLVFTITIFSQAFLGSYWSEIHTSLIWQACSYGLFALLGVVTFIEFVATSHTWQELLAFSFLALMLLLFIFKKDINMILIFLFCAAGMLMSIERILRVYLAGISLGIVSVLLACFFNILPLTNEEGLKSFGFVNPNTLGAYLFFAYAIFLLKCKHRFRVISVSMYFIFSVFILFVLEDYTAFLMCSLFSILVLSARFEKNLLNLWIVKWILAFLPVALTYLTFWIAKNYYTYFWMVKLNDLFTSRPILWNFYYSNFPPTIFGTELPENIIFGHGAFDGAYIYYPIVHGILPFSIIMLILIAGTYMSAKQRNVFILIFLVVLIIFAFSEGIPFRVTQSPLLPISVLVCVMGKRKEQLLNESR